MARPPGETKGSQTMKARKRRGRQPRATTAQRQARALELAAAAEACRSTDRTSGTGAALLALGRLAHGRR